MKWGIFIFSATETIVASATNLLPTKEERGIPLMQFADLNGEVWILFVIFASNLLQSVGRWLLQGTIVTTNYKR